jgi:hypothetical protein
MTTPNGDGPIIRQFGESSEQQVKGHMVLWSAHSHTLHGKLPYTYLLIYTAQLWTRTMNLS